MSDEPGIMIAQALLFGALFVGGTILLSGGFIVGGCIAMTCGGLLIVYWTTGDE